MATKAICFNCHFVGIGIGDPHCPVCSFPLIKNTEPVALGANDLDRLFERPATPPPGRKALPLPGVSAEPRAAQLLIEKRRARAEHQAATKKRAAARAARRRSLARFVAASAFLAGLVGALGVMGAL